MKKNGTLKETKNKTNESEIRRGSERERTNEREREKEKKKNKETS